MAIVVGIADKIIQIFSLFSSGAAEGVGLCLSEGGLIGETQHVGSECNGFGCEAECLRRSF